LQAATKSDHALSDADRAHASESRSITSLGMSASNPVSNQRYRALDGYRFIAASLVVLYHYNGDFGLGLEHATPAVKSLTVMVDFFFVLSGFVIATTYAEAMSNLRDYGDFLRRRLARSIHCTWQFSAFSSAWRLL
jgi:peptidoglycan/LPS O-acetylase OafA/YrhL